MRFQEFIDALYDAGWVSKHDAQYSEIKKLHKKLFPAVSELELELKEIEDSCSDLIRKLKC